jgi:hypothetical protein
MEPPDTPGGFSRISTCYLPVTLDLFALTLVANLRISFGCGYLIPDGERSDFYVLLFVLAGKLGAQVRPL